MLTSTVSKLGLNSAPIPDEINELVELVILLIRDDLICSESSALALSDKPNDIVSIELSRILDKLELKLVAEKLDNKAKGKALEKIIKAEINKEISTPFDFIKGPLIRVRLFEAPKSSHCETTSKQFPSQYVLVFNHHHIISDGVSVDIILKELSEFYQANIENRSPKLAKLPIQYVDFAAWQRAEFKKPEFQDKLKYWKDILCDYSDLQLPVDKSRPATFSYKGADFAFSLII